MASNSAGCGLALQKSLRGEVKYQDVLGFLGELGPIRRERRPGDKTRVYVDLPCHLVHGQKAGIPDAVLNATGYQWQLAPAAKDCCGSGGIYNIQKPENAREILARKSQFLNEAEGEPIVLATSNHVCMMQWNSARFSGLVKSPFRVRHIIQLLDPVNR